MGRQKANRYKQKEKFPHFSKAVTECKKDYYVC